MSFSVATTAPHEVNSHFTVKEQHKCDAVCPHWGSYGESNLMKPVQGASGWHVHVIFELFCWWWWSGTHNIRVCWVFVLFFFYLNMREKKGARHKCVTVLIYYTKCDERLKIRMTRTTVTHNSCGKTRSSWELETLLPLTTRGGLVRGQIGV